MRKVLLAAAAVGGLTALMGFGTTATAAPVTGAFGQSAVAPQHVVQADWYWHHHHWHHRRWYNHRWHYWD